MTRASILPLLFVLAATPAPASDLAKEQRWAEQIVDALIDGEAVWLSAAGERFLGIYAEADDPGARRAMILAHGIGVHPDWDQVVKPIRVEMLSRGWNTLSIQMPILPNEASAEDYWPLYDEVAPRIEAAVEFLRAKGASTLVIAAHSLGGSMAAYYLAHNPGAPVAAFVAVGMNAAQDNPEVNTARSLERIRIPVLDLYGSNDLAMVLDTAAARARAAAVAGNPRFEQQVIAGAGHFFDGHNDALLQAIEAWLRRTVP